MTEVSMWLLYAVTFWLSSSSDIKDIRMFHSEVDCHLAKISLENGFDHLADSNHTKFYACKKVPAKKSNGIELTPNSDDVDKWFYIPDGYHPGTWGTK